MCTTANQFPSSPGTYVLMVSLPDGQSIQVGRLARIHFISGTYAYVGSARGPGGLSARLGRHLRGIKKKHWHIDYLLPHVRVESVWMRSGRQSLEHQWAATLERQTGTVGSVKGFGCSDCTCYSHLFHFNSMPSARIMGTMLDGAFCWTSGDQCVGVT